MLKKIMNLKSFIKYIFKKLFLYIFLISILFLLIFLFTIFFNIYYKQNNLKIFNLSNNHIQNSNYVNNLDNKNNKTNPIEYRLYENIDAYLTIPILNLYNAPISEGTSQEVMEKFIGHFENTNHDVGNIGLASHNRGNGATYFKELNKLKKGDCILYTYKNSVKKYIVNNIVIINSYDWSYLQKTSENKLTLITCINDKPNLRLCVQATQI